jgi:KaiC/GvpD/RAD55 family RecA-like ATPase|tara:strand:+ start:380 stop:1411 length:1032 start_codon:yes stop_codon:yes gene_type:complete
MNPEFNTDSFNEDLKLVDKPTTTVPDGNMFECMTANEWMVKAKDTPIPKPLYLSMWHEGEIGFLIGSTNTGKSLLAVVIALKIAKHQVVIYIDLEMSEIQFRIRYSEGNKDYKFPDNFYRIAFKDQHTIPEGTDATDYIIQSFEEIAEKYDAKVMIIDNVTYLGASTGTSKDVLPLLRKLKNWQRKRKGLSLLILGHTPKRPDSQPLTINDIFGSSMQGNFCDVAFAIGHSIKDTNWRYVKQLKARLCAIEYDASNVVIYEIDKLSNGLLDLVYQKESSEKEHTIKEFDPNEDTDEAKWSIAFNHRKEGLSDRAIGREMGTSHGTIGKWIRKHIKAEAEKKEN